jgi:cytochrome b
MINIEKKYIYDLTTRLLHASIGISTLILFLTAKLSKYYYEDGPLRHIFWQIHIVTGYTLICFIFIRFIYFFIGPKYSKLAEFFKWKEWRDIIFKQKITWGWGHHPLGALAYLLIYAVIVQLIYSGLYLARIQFDQGPIANKLYDEVFLLTKFLELHELGSSVFILFTIGHVFSLFWHQTNDGVPILQSMFNGFQYKKSKNNIKEDK